MAAPKGNKFAKGGARPGAGHPTAFDAAVKAALINGYWAGVQANLEGLLAKYFKGKDAPKDVINRAVPYAKQEIEHSGEIGVKEWRVDAYEPKKKEKK